MCPEEVIETMAHSIAEDIKTKDFLPCYLLYGEESYQIRYYKNQLVKALAGDDTMNFARYQGKGVREDEVESFAETLPFFAERRVILIEDAGLFSSQNRFPEILEKMPATTVMVFTEASPDKRSRLYKTITKIGLAVEYKPLQEEQLKRWFAGLLAREGKKMTIRDMEHLFLRSGTDMNVLSNEAEKLIALVGDREIIDSKDIDAVCPEQLAMSIFRLTDAIGMKNRKTAVEAYEKLLASNEPPLRILYMLNRQFHLLLQVKNMKAASHSDGEIASVLKIPPFTVRNYAAQARNFKKAELEAAYLAGTKLEEAVKTGRITDQMAVETFIIQYA